ncbi:ABC transporter permease [Tenggerimyces flavus]|uniref:ABC transporter permease n=1 Tax=Tenggerimyces flavus TaxID=1708749 RepID=A0ABV7Y9Z8_9ACTN|nr:ABC transporter permease [Tenggerimyces flavus]MBM7786659.1 ABC-2 type transport system permease protein [Tenggerimyces flavus]
MRPWLALVGAEMKMVARDTGGLVIPLGLPVLILVMNGLGNQGEVIPGTGGRTAIDLFILPVVLTMVVATIGVINLPSFLAGYRRAGILRRLAVTPTPPMRVLVAQLVTSLVQTLVGIAFALLVAVLAFDVRLPASPILAFGVFGLAALAMYAIGLLIAALAPTANSSVAIGLVAFFAMGAVGGMFGGTRALPDVLARVGEVLPFGAAVHALGTAWAGNSPALLHLVSLAAATVIAGLVAARFFRWE